MKIRKVFKKLNVLQLLTVVLMILLLPIYKQWFGYGFQVAFTVFLMVSMFLPNWIGRLYGLTYDEIKYSIMGVLVIIWTFLLYNISPIIRYMYDLGAYVYLVSLIPVLVLVLYLTYHKEWRNFYGSLNRLYLEDYIRRKAQERGKEIETEFEKTFKE